MAGEPSADRSWLGRESAPDERRGGAAAAHSACYSTPSTRGLDIVFSGRFDLFLGFRSESVPRCRARLCRRPGTLRAPKRAVHTVPPWKIFTSTTGAWGVRPRPDGAAPGVRRATAALVGSRTRFRAKSGLQKARRPPPEALRPGSRPENGPSETETDPTPYASRGQPLTRTSLPSQNRCANASPSQRLTAALAPQPPRTLCTPLHSFAR